MGCREEGLPGDVGGASLETLQWRGKEVTGERTERGLGTGMHSHVHGGENGEGDATHIIIICQIYCTVHPLLRQPRPCRCHLQGCGQGYGGCRQIGIVTQAQTTLSYQTKTGIIDFLSWKTLENSISQLCTREFLCGGGWQRRRGPNRKSKLTEKFNLGMKNLCRDGS